MTKSPEELIYDNEGKLKKKSRHLFSFSCEKRTVSSSKPFLIDGPMSSLVLWKYPDGYMTSAKRYPTDVGMIHVKGK